VAARIEEQLEQVLGIVRDVLGPDVVGAYLHGSAVLDGLRAHSDLDVLVVSRRRTSLEEKDRLVSRLLAGTGSRPLELTIVVESEIRPWRFPPNLDFQYGEWFRGAFESGNLEPWETPNPDLAVLIAIALLGNRPLLGPPPTEVFDPVPRRDCVRAMVDGIEGFLDDLDGDATNVLLTLARIWTTIAAGDIRSKDAAADWALVCLPPEHRPVLARARAVYLGDEEDRWDDLAPRIRPLADHLVSEIAADAS
jgi:streptomycin 3"-adenylyltransferase